MEEEKHLETEEGVPQSAPCQDALGITCYMTCPASNLFLYIFLDFIIQFSIFFLLFVLSILFELFI
jgi:hypothetical protein